MDPLRYCYSRLFIFMICCTSYLTFVSGLECHSCSALGVAGSNLNEACINFDENEIGTEPCTTGQGQVGRCAVFVGSVTINPPFIGEQSASGTIRYCEVFNEENAPPNTCHEATEIPNDLLSGVFSVTNFLGLDEAIQGEVCYCSKNRCNAATTVVFSYVNMVALLILSIIFCTENVRAYFL